MLLIFHSLSMFHEASSMLWILYHRLRHHQLVLPNITLKLHHAKKTRKSYCPHDRGHWRACWPIRDSAHKCTLADLVQWFTVWKTNLQDFSSDKCIKVWWKNLMATGPLERCILSCLTEGWKNTAAHEMKAVKPHTNLLYACISNNSYRKNNVANACQMAQRNNYDNPLHLKLWMIEH